MNKAQYKKLVELCSVQSHSHNEKIMVWYLCNKLEKLRTKKDNYHIEWWIDNIGNICVVKDENVASENTKTYPCIVSHMDTVHEIVDNYYVKEFIKEKSKIRILRAVTELETNNRTGIGGDDKCGIFACLYLLETLPKVKIVFFTQEETGCRGSRNIDLSFFEDCRYIIQLDRKDRSDFIAKFSNQSTISHKFSSKIGRIKKEFGYKNTTGLFTDCFRLWERKVGISCINLSCGYYEPHSDDEYIVIDDLENSIYFTESIIEALGDWQYRSLPAKKIHTYGRYNTSSIVEQHMCRLCNRLKPGKRIQGKWYCYMCLIWDVNKKSYVLPSGSADDNKKIEYLASHDECKTCKHNINNICTTKSSVCTYEEYIAPPANSEGDKCDICQEKFPSELVEMRVYHDRQKKPFEIYTCNDCHDFMNTTEPNHE
jgi:putative aminopeptidase FrvX